MGVWSRSLTALLLLPAACAAPPPPPPPPTALEVTLHADADSNPSGGGQGAPVLLRIYQLDSADGFADADFFALFGRDTDVLKADLLKREDNLMSPGATRTETISPSPQAHAIGVFAAYRDHAHGAWRGVAQIPAHQTTAIRIIAGRDGITLSATPVPAPAPAASGS